MKQQYNHAPPMSKHWWVRIHSVSIHLIGHCVCVCAHARARVYHLVLSYSFSPHGLQPASLLCPWHFLGKKMGVGCHSLPWGIFLTQGSNPGLSQCGQILYHLSHKESPIGHCQTAKNNNRDTKRKRDNVSQWTFSFKDKKDTQHVW